MTTEKNGLADVATINERLLNPTPTPLALRCDLVDRLAPMDLKKTAGWFVNLVADRIADTGKHINDLTVREVRQIVEKCRIATNKAAKRRRYWWKLT